MNTFESTGEVIICILIIAVLFGVLLYRNMSSAFKTHLSFIDLFLELNTFVKRQRPNKRKSILEKTVFSVILVLADENF
jgi:hypothetical protein